MSNWDYVVLTIYMVGVLSVGFLFSGKRDDREFFLAGENMPWWAVGISIFGTQLSAITFMAIPAKAFAEDWTFIIGQLGILIAAPLVILHYLPVYRRQNLTTVYEYLERRFNVGLRLIGASLFILLQLGRMGVVIFLPAIALSAATGMNIYLAILMCGGVTTVYATLGGMAAIIWKDVVQVIVLLGGALLSAAVILFSLGDVAGSVNAAAESGKLQLMDLTPSILIPSVYVIFVGQIFANLTSYTADQTVVQRYLTTSTMGEARRSVLLNAVLSVPASILFFGMGTLLWMYYAAFPDSGALTGPADAIFPYFIVNELPVGVSGLLIAAIFAAAMSSLDSSINSVVATIVNDFIKRFSPGSTAASRLLLGRLLTVVLGVFATGTALLFASLDIKSLFDIFLEVIGLAGGSLGGLLALAIFSKKATSRDALVGVLTAVAATIAAKYATPIHFLTYAAIGFVTCFGVGVLMSRLPFAQARATQSED